MRGQVKVYQKKLVQKRRRRIFYISLYTVVLIGFIFAALSYISQTEALSLREISVRGNERLSAGEIESFIKNDISGNYGMFFSKANAFLYPRAYIQEKLQTIPAIQIVAVSRSGFNTLVINLTERDEVAEWCLDQINGACFSLDEDGLIFAPVLIQNASSTKNAAFKYKSILEGDVLGKHIPLPADFKKIQFFIHDIENLHTDPIFATFSTTTDYMTVALKGGGRIIVNAGDDLSLVLQNISTVLQDRSVAPSFSDFLAHLDYIKFDAGNRVVFKMRGIEKEVKK